MLKIIRNFLEFYPESDANYWKKELEENYQEAKYISDFIGMLVQLSIFSVAINYFYSKLFGGAESLFLLGSFATCLIVMSFLSIALLYKISSLVVGFILQGVGLQKKRWVKYIVLFAAIFLALLVMNGVVHLVDDLAVTHSLERVIQDGK